MAASVRSSSSPTPASAQSVTITTPAGAASGDKLIAFVYADGANPVWSAATPADWTQVANESIVGPPGGVLTTFERVLTAAPAANYTFNINGGVNRDLNAVMVCLNPDGAAWGTTVASDVARIATATATSEAVTGTASDSILVIGWASVNNRAITTAPATMTLARFSDGGSADLAVYTELAPGAGSLTRTLEWASSTNTAVNAVLAVTAVAGPTITVQPVAQTKVLTNANTATFGITATGTGGLTYDWELENGVGSGVYADVADGNGATWTGRTTTSLVGTFTAKTLSGRRVRCNVTDSNGTTTSTAVALTLFDGPQLTTFPATNGSGVSTATLTCDYVTGVGEAIEVRIPLSDGDVAVTVTTT
jgi:hypothetical protein